MASAAPSLPSNDAQCRAVVGLQWGDEGKGKVIDLLAGQSDAVVRYNGGANAGHSVVVNGERFALHLIPCGVFHDNTQAIIGNGVVVDPFQLLKEVDGLEQRGISIKNLALSSRAHVVMSYHKDEDALREQVLSSSSVGSPKVHDQAIGTTKRGIGPAYSDKAARSTAIRVGDLLKPDVLNEKLERVSYFKNKLLASHTSAEEHEDFAPRVLADRCAEIAERISPLVTDTTYLLHDLLDQGKSLLFEGANATLLDVDHGTYPYVTSSNCSALGIPAGTGVPGSRIRSIVGVAKAYSTRVGAGPFPTELDNEIGDRIRKQGNEFGTTTGRPRRCGWLDLVAVKYSAMVNGIESIGLTLLDVLSGIEELQVCTAYQVDGETTDRFLPDAADLGEVTPVYKTMPGWTEDITEVRTRSGLPTAAQDYLAFIEDFIGKPISVVGVGPDREQVILSDQ
ncbi:MAG: adenylosuccinate synthase [Planctomycetota bacterium]